MALLSSFLTEVLQSLRSLRREKSFTFAVLATMALCIAANVVIFSVVRSVLLRPLPYERPERLVVLANSYYRLGISDIGCSAANCDEFREGIGSFESLALCRRGTDSVIYGNSDSPTRINALEVAPPLFSVLGVKPVLGRGFSDDEDRRGREGVVILSHSFWRAQFGGSPSALGKTILVDSVPYRIVGVMGPEFRYLSKDVQLYRPLVIPAENRASSNRHSNLMYDLIGRLKTGSTLAEAQAQVDAFNDSLAAGDSPTSFLRTSGFRTRVEDLHASHVQRVRPTLLLLQAAALFLLLIGGANLVNLFVVRSLGRARESALREVLGCGKARHAVRVIAVPVLLCVAGGIVGLCLGSVMLKGLPAVGVDRLPMTYDLRIDWQVLTVAFAGAAGTGILLSFPVLFCELRRENAAALGHSSRGGTASRSLLRMRQLLIAGQVALVFVLLSGAGLLALSFKKVFEAPSGFNAENTLCARFGLPSSLYREEAKRFAFTRELLGNLRAEAGVQAVGISTCIPLDDSVNTNSFRIDGYQKPEGQPEPNHYMTWVAGDYFRAQGIPVIEGRALNDEDSEAPGYRCVVDRELARRYWPDSSPIGHTLSFYRGKNGNDAPHYEIVGVVENTKQFDLAESNPRGMVFLPFNKGNVPYHAYMIARTLQGPSQAAAQFRDALRRTDAGIPLDALKTNEARLDERLSERRATLLLAGLFAAAALLLSALGVYGMLAYAVSQRQREIGVRMAMGAQPGQVLRLFLGIGIKILCLGFLFGLFGSYFAGRALSGLLYQVTPLNVPILMMAALVISAMVMAASLLPSRRAAMMHPVDALRSE